MGQVGGNCAQGKGSKVRGGGKRKIVTRLKREARDIGGEGDHEWKGTPLSASAQYVLSCVENKNRDIETK